MNNYVIILLTKVGSVQLSLTRLHSSCIQSLSFDIQPKNIRTCSATVAEYAIKTKYPIQATMATNDGSCESKIRIYEFCDLQKSLEEKDKTKFNLIDVREEAEIKETGMVPGAIHVPLGQVSSALDSSNEEFKQKYQYDKPKPDDPLVFMCKAGRRSYEAAKIAVQKSYTDVGSYKHGFPEWYEKVKQLESN